MDILSIIPQRPPFVMVDRLITCDEENGTHTTFLVTENNVLVYNNELTEAGLVENIAQTAAAGAGYVSQLTGEPILTGYIAAIKNLEVFALPKTGDILKTKVIIVNKIFDVTIITGAVECNNALLAKCEMKIFVKN